MLDEYIENYCLFCLKNRRFAKMHPSDFAKMPPQKKKQDLLVIFYHSRLKWTFFFKSKLKSDFFCSKPHLTDGYFLQKIKFTYVYRHFFQFFISKKSKMTNCSANQNPPFLHFFTFFHLKKELKLPCSNDFLSIIGHLPESPRTLKSIFNFFF